MRIGDMEVSDEFAADLIEGLRRRGGAVFRRELAKVALDWATRDLPAGPRRAPDLNGEGEESDG